MPRKKPDGKYFTFRQNNSGGSFDVDENVGVTVVIQAKDAFDANRRAKKIGIYFGGRGDCPCCGDRWYSLGEDEKGDDVPSQYGTPIGDTIVEGGSYFDTSIRIHRMDGSVVRLNKKL